MELHTFITCLIAVTLLTVTPGVDTILVIRNSLRGGWRDGLTTSFGICSGLFVHALISAMGISLLLLKTAWAFSALKFFGALYLIYLGISGIYSSYQSPSSAPLSTLTTQRSSYSVIRSFREGLLSNVLNPKAVIFYLAFLPQFISPEGSEIFQSLLVASMHFSVAMIYGLFLALASDKASCLFTDQKFSRFFHWISGSFLVILGLKLLFTKEL